MGTVSAVAFALDGSTALQFAVIKKPHDYARIYFADEVNKALLVQTWNDPHINKAISVSDKYIIYESGQNARDLHNALKTMGYKEALQAFRQVIEGVIAYQSKGYFHGDIKEPNVIIFDTPNGPKVQLIDNSPISGKDLKQGKISSWISTPGYSDNVIGLKIINDPNVDYHAIDSFSLGVIAKNIGKKFGANYGTKSILDISDLMQNPDISGKEDFLPSLLLKIDNLIAHSPDTAQKAA